MCPSGQEASDEPNAKAQPAHEDAELVACVLQKDRKATADFVCQYADSVYGYVRARLAPHYDQVDDLVQEIFLAAWQGLKQYRGAGALRSWILGIARHRVEEHYRQRLRAADVIDRSEEDPVPQPVVFDFDQLLERDEMRARAQRVLQELPDLYRLVLVWRYWHEISAREMALKTGKTEKAIERLLARARAEFRERWSDARSSR
ncbi:MAG: sigma-70 family RNA polymerase sigma factor [Terriglobales bacterium]